MGGYERKSNKNDGWLSWKQAIHQTAAEWVLKGKFFNFQLFPPKIILESTTIGIFHTNFVEWVTRKSLSLQLAIFNDYLRREGELRDIMLSKYSYASIPYTKNEESALRSVFNPICPDTYLHTSAKIRFQMYWEKNLIFIS